MSINVNVVKTFDELCCLCALRKTSISSFVSIRSELGKDLSKRFSPQLSNARCLGSQVRFLHKYNGDFALMAITLSPVKFELGITVTLLKRSDVLYISLEEMEKYNKLQII